MSVSLAMLPVALAMRLVMGKEKFDEFVAAQQLRVPTSFSDELELARTVRKAGYDAEKFGSSIKTHIDGERHFFFWEFVEGLWVAVFYKGDSDLLRKKFMEEVEVAAGKPVFKVTSDTEPQTGTREFPTNFRDQDLLLRTLRDFGIDPVVRANGRMTCSLGRSRLTFMREGDEAYRVEVDRDTSLSELHQCLSHLDEDYRNSVQADVYQKVKARAASKGMKVVAEEIRDDESIVVTLAVNSVAR